MIARIAGDHDCLGDDHRGATARPLGVADLVALGRETVGGAEVCPHRAHHDAILQRSRADRSCWKLKPARLICLTGWSMPIWRPAVARARSGKVGTGFPTRSCSINNLACDGESI